MKQAFIGALLWVGLSLGIAWTAVAAFGEEPAAQPVVESVDFNTQYNVTRCYYITATGQTLFCERVDQ